DVLAKPVTDRLSNATTAQTAAPAAAAAGIERLALEIAENGFDESQPLLVFPIREGSKTVLAVRDGHRRLQAVRLANHYLDDGKNRQIDQLPVIIEEWADPRSLTLSVMQR
ncbi:ParB/Srx family N-terminal domain-containing protein, partial [Chromohalobacter sp. HP20-39]|uniref:ParB/Srx family N-terminal domain-containing protein n=1 Tax=Chromohalobacter sp. HP20-39 TaxID=3079306 RepID=UPI00294B6B18